MSGFLAQKNSDCQDLDLDRALSQVILEEYPEVGGWVAGWGLRRTLSVLCGRPFFVSEKHRRGLPPSEPLSVLAVLCQDENSE